MNRTFALFGVLLAVAVLMTACGSSETTVKTTTPAASAEPTTAEEDQAVDSVVVSDEADVELGELY